MVEPVLRPSGPPIQLTAEVDAYARQIPTCVLGLCGTQGQGKTTLLRQLLQLDLGQVPDDAQVGTTCPHRFVFSHRPYFAYQCFSRDEVADAVAVALHGDDDHRDVILDVLNDAGIDEDITMPQAYDQFYNLDDRQDFNDPTELLDGLVEFYTRMREVDQIGVLVRNVEVGLPSPILRWMTLVDLPGDEDMFPHRNAYFFDRVADLDVVLLVHRRGLGAISRKTRLYWRRVLQAHPNVKFVITHSSVRDPATRDDVQIRKALPRDHLHVMDNPIRLDLVDPVQLEDLTRLLDQLLQQSNILENVAGIEPAALAGLTDELNKAVNALRPPVLTEQYVRQALYGRIQRLCRIKLGAMPGNRDLKYAQLRRMVVPGLGPEIDRQLARLNQHNLRVKDQEFPFNCNIQIADLLSGWCEQRELVDFLQAMNTECGTGTADRLERRVWSDFDFIPNMVIALQEFVNTRFQERLQTNRDAIAHYLHQTQQLTEESRAAITIFQEQVRASTVLRAD